MGQAANELPDKTFWAYAWQANSQCPGSILGQHTTVAYMPRLYMPCCIYRICHFL